MCVGYSSLAAITNECGFNKEANPFHLRVLFLFEHININVATFELRRISFFHVCQVCITAWYFMKIETKATRGERNRVSFGCSLSWGAMSYYYSILTLAKSISTFISSAKLQQNALIHMKTIKTLLNLIVTLWVSPLVFIIN